MNLDILDKQAEPPVSRISKHYAVLAVAVLALAAFNLTYRLGLESVDEWDESLYATSAWEMVGSGNLVGTTFDGQLDYSNSKPPLTVWLIAASFWAFGTNLISLRAGSALFAWLTVLALQVWTRRVWGPGVSLLSSLVLSTTFGFLHLHSGRSGNPDALQTLLVVLCVVSLWAGQRQPWYRVWLGPILAGVFLLKGMAVLLPLLLVVVVDVAWHDGRSRWRANVAAIGVFAGLVGAWAVARWQVDRWLFFERLVNQDLLEVSLTARDGRGGGPFFYLDILQKHQYDWLVAAVFAALLVPRLWRGAAAATGLALRDRRPAAVLVAAWAGVTLLVPTAMQSKLSWYLNPFYPVFAVLVALVLTQALAHLAPSGRTWRTAAVGLLIVAAVTTAEARSLWRLQRVTNLNTSAQGLLLARRGAYAGRRVCRDRLSRAEAFVVKALVGARYHVIDPTAAASGKGPNPGDVFLLSREAHDDRLQLVGQADGHFLYEPR